MAKFIGRREALWIRQENPRLSGNTSGGQWIRWKSKDTQNKAEHIQNMGAVGRIEDNTGTQVAKLYSETSLDFDFYDEYSQLVQSFFNGNSGAIVSLVGTTAGTAQGISNTNEPTTYTIGYSGLDNMWVSSGNIVKSVSITSDAGGSDFNSCSVSFVGFAYISGSLPAVSFVSNAQKYLPSQTDFYLSSGSGSALSGLRNIKSFTLSAERNADADYAFGSTSPSNFFAKQFQHTLEATVNLDSTNNTDADSGFYKQYHQSGTDLNAEVRMIGTRILSGVATPSFRFDIKGNMTDYKEDKPLDDIVTQTFTITGSRLLSNSSGLVFSYVQSGNYV